MSDGVPSSGVKGLDATDIEMIFRLSENGQRIYEMPLDSCVKSKSAAGFFHQQIGIAIQVIRHALHF